MGSLRWGTSQNVYSIKVYFGHRLGFPQNFKMFGNVSLLFKLTQNKWVLENPETLYGPYCSELLTPQMTKNREMRHQHHCSPILEVLFYSNGIPMWDKKSCGLLQDRLNTFLVLCVLCEKSSNCFIWNWSSWHWMCSISTPCCGGFSCNKKINPSFSCLETVVWCVLSMGLICTRWYRLWFPLKVGI